MPTEPPDRLSALSRCVAADPRTFASEYWGRKPLLSPSGALPRDFGDLLSADTVDELIAERGVRAPFIRLAKEGDVLARDCYLGPAGFGAEMPDQVDSAKVLAQFASGATIVLQGLHRLWPPLIDFVRAAVDELGHPVQANAYITPPTNRGFDPHYDVHDVFVLQAAGQKRWSCTNPCTAIPAVAAVDAASRGDSRPGDRRARHRSDAERERPGDEPLRRAAEPDTAGAARADARNRARMRPRRGMEARTAGDQTGSAARRRRQQHDHEARRGGGRDEADLRGDQRRSESHVCANARGRGLLLGIEPDR